MKTVTTVSVDLDTIHDLHQIAVDLGRQEQRNVTMLEVIRRLIDAWSARS